MKKGVFRAGSHIIPSEPDKKPFEVLPVPTHAVTEVPGESSRTKTPTGLFPVDSTWILGFTIQGLDGAGPLLF